MTERVQFRDQARSAYSRDFGVKTLSDADGDDLDRRTRLSRWPVLSAVAAVVVLVVMGVGVRVPVTVVVTPVSAAAGQVIAVPPPGTATAGLVGADAELRHGTTRLAAAVVAQTRWPVGDRQVAAVVLRPAGPVGALRPDEVTAVVTVGEQSLFEDLTGSSEG